MIDKISEYWLNSFNLFQRKLHAVNGGKVHQNGNSKKSEANGYAPAATENGYSHSENGVLNSHQGENTKGSGNRNRVRTRAQSRKDTKVRKDM